MQFACSHVVCNWRSDGAGGSVSRPEYENIVGVKQQKGQLPPPLPPRHLRKPRPSSLPLDLIHSTQPSHAPLSLSPPVPPRLDLLGDVIRSNVNVNVVSLDVGKLVDISQEEGLPNFQSPVICEKCSAALSCLSSVHEKVWVCEFCGCKTGVDEGVSRLCIGQRAGVYSDDLYLPKLSDNDYQNLEDTLVVFCVDISGSMCVTTEVSGSHPRMIVLFLQGVQDALQKTLTSMLQHTPHRRVALVTFNDEVVIYGDGTRTPLTLRDWALLDYDHIWQQATAYRIPHCIAETHHHLIQRVKELMEHGATALGSAALAAVAMASRYPGSKVVLCTDGRANIGLGDLEQPPHPSSPAQTPFFYRQLALQAVEKGVIISVMTFKGTDCCLADIGRLADATGGRVGFMYFPYETESNKLVREIGNVTRGLEITFQFAVKPDVIEVFLQKNTLPFQLQLNFKTRDQQRVTRVLTEQRPVTTTSRILVGKLNIAVLDVHCAQLCASLTMEGRVQEAQNQLQAQQDLKLRPIQKQENIYGNWMETMTTICDDITTGSQVSGCLIHYRNQLLKPFQFPTT
uniref:Si:dkey-9k7.3 n=1 Tax=Nothobranchius furzeri TaxID=105023 RepID=A0A8C6LP92_NOTFU